MLFIDTHTHLYLEEFDADRRETIHQAFVAYVTRMIQPNIDSLSIQKMRSLCNLFPEHCFPTAGLHPTSVGENFMDEMATVEEELKTEKNYAIGETGMDLYWDKTFFKEQEYCFNRQLELAVQYNLPVIIHARNALTEIFSIIKNFEYPLPKGVFHCFPGTLEEAEQVIDWGFYLGIGGVVTFKNSTMADVVQKVSLQHIVLETDAPYLAPIPFRGKRNQSSYIPLIAQRVAELKQVSIEEIATMTTQNAMQLFQLP